MSYINVLLISVSLTLAAGQRPSFAGTRPIGFPEVIRTTTDGLTNRFGEDDIPTTTIRLPIEANGDRDLVDRISKLPVDQQPFWYINWQALEEHRKNPQTYPQKPNVFAESMASNQQQSSQQQTAQQLPSQQQQQSAQQSPSGGQFPQQQFPNRGQFPQQQMPSQFPQQQQQLSLQQQQAALQQQQMELQQQQQQLAEERRKFMELQQQYMQQQQQSQLSNRNGLEPVTSASNVQLPSNTNPNQNNGRFSWHNHNHGNKPRTPSIDN